MVSVSGRNLKKKKYLGHLGTFIIYLPHDDLETGSTGARVILHNLKKKKKSQLQRTNCRPVQRERSEIIN